MDLLLLFLKFCQNNSRSWFTSITSTSNQTIHPVILHMDASSPPSTNHYPQVETPFSSLIVTLSPAPFPPVGHQSSNHCAKHMVPRSKFVASSRLHRKECSNSVRWTPRLISVFPCHPTQPITPHCTLLLNCGLPGPEEPAPHNGSLPAPAQPSDTILQALIFHPAKTIAC